MSIIPDQPIGSINMYPGSLIPPGWRLCDGSSVKREELAASDYQELAASLGQLPDSESLSLPKMTGRFPVGVGRDASLREVGGADSHEHELDFKSIKIYNATALTPGDRGKVDVNGIRSGSSVTISFNIPLQRKNILLSKDAALTSGSTTGGPKYYALNFIIRVSE